MSINHLLVPLMYQLIDDETRVILDKMEESHNMDYINASFIQVRRFAFKLNRCVFDGFFLKQN